MKRKMHVLVLMTALLWVAGCNRDTTPVGAQRSAGPKIVPIPAVAPVASPTPPNPFALFVKAADGVLVANPDLTPGHVVADATDVSVCAPGYGIDLRHVDYGPRAGMFADYGVPWSEHKQYQVDNLIPLTLGGDNSRANIWPMPLSGPAGPDQKAALTNKLHDLVCSKKLSLAAAQTAISANWWAAYQQYGRPAPVVQEMPKAICAPVGAKAQTQAGKPLVCETTKGNRLRWQVVAPSASPSPSSSPSAAAAGPTGIPTKRPIGTHS